MRNPATTACLAALAAGTVHGARPSGSSFGVPGVDATYDYVVVGGGTAGLTLASRLVEQKAGSVAVIEAGTFYEQTGNTSQVPALAGTWVGKSPNDTAPMADWGYVTTPQSGAHNLEMHYPRGKMLGGCSARNFMIYQRPTEGSLQNWADAVGDDSYTFDKFLPYFEKSLNFTPPDEKVRPQNASVSYDYSVLGTSDGPLSITFPAWAYAFGSWAAKALTEIGIPIQKENFNNGKLFGFAYAMFTINPATQNRESSETSFLQKELNNPDLYVYPLTLGKKVLFSKDSKTANGVRVNTAGTDYTLLARKEVIVTAGAIGSPQLLQASGVGPADLLKSHNVDVIADLPGVGQNMQDHVVFGVSHGVNVITASSFGNPAFLAEQVRLFDQEARGAFTNPGADILAWEKLPNNTRGAMSNTTIDKLSKLPTDWPEVEYITFSSYLGDSSVLRDPADGNAYATLSVVLVAPMSRGSVKITSSDTAVQPAIDPAYLTDRTDVEVAVRGFKRAREFWASSALNGLTVGGEAYPGANITSDAQIEDAIKGSFQTIYHGSCTCAMGKASDPNAVIDSQARVYGVKGLRVVDASSFPLLPPGHPQSVVYALAEKIACDISGNCKSY